MRILFYAFQIALLTLTSALWTDISKPEINEQEKLLDFFAKEWVARAIYSATKLEIADHLEKKSLSIEELAACTQTHQSSLNRLLQVLVQHGIFNQDEQGRYCNNCCSSLLIKNNPNSLHALSLFYGEEIHAVWDDIVTSIQTGTPAFNHHYNCPVFPYFNANPKSLNQFQAAMKQKTKAVIDSVLALYDFSSYQSVCDIGGGNGFFLQHLLSQNQNLHGALFELASVIDSNQIIPPLKNHSRCDLIAGDFFNSIPAHHDIYLLKSVLHDWDDEKARIILSQCCNAMNSKSKLLIIEAVQGPNRPYASCMDFLMMAITGGQERTVKDYQKLFETSGLILNQVITTNTEFSILEVSKK